MNTTKIYQVYHKLGLPLYDNPNYIHFYTEETFNECNINHVQQYFNEFKNVSKDLLPWLENLAWECRCKIEKKEWKSKYNNYVIYDYEPFCSDGFEINITLSSRQDEYLNFVRYLF